MVASGVAPVMSMDRLPSLIPLPVHELTIELPLMIQFKCWLPEVLGTNKMSAFAAHSDRVKYKVGCFALTILNTESVTL